MEPERGGGERRSFFLPTEDKLQIQRRDQRKSLKESVVLYNVA